MRWQVIVGTGAALLVGLSSGCGGERKVLAYDRNMLQEIAQAGLGPPTPLSRAQKPEITPTSTSDTRPLETEPERPTDLVGVAPSARILATVNGHAILEQEVRATCFRELAAIAGLPEKEQLQKQKEILSAGSEQLIDRELILQDMENKLGATKPGQKALEKIREAATKEFENNWVKNMMEVTQSSTLEELKVKLRQAGMPFEMAKRHSERQFMSTEFAKHNIFPKIEKYTSHLYIQEYYETHPEEFMASDTVEWQDLFVDARKHPTRDAAQRFADVLAARARRGENFSKLAEQFDNGDSSLRDNALGIGQKRGEIRPVEAETTLFRMREGEVSVVELSTGFHVVKSLKRTMAGLTPFDEKAQKRIRDKLRMEIFQRELKRYVVDLRRKAIIVKPESN